MMNWLHVVNTPSPKTQTPLPTGGYPTMASPVTKKLQNKPKHGIGRRVQAMEAA